MLLSDFDGFSKLLLLIFILSACLSSKHNRFAFLSVSSLKDTLDLDRRHPLKDLRTKNVDVAIERNFIQFSMNSHFGFELELLDIVKSKFFKIIRNERRLHNESIHSLRGKSDARPIPTKASYNMSSKNSLTSAGSSTEKKATSAAFVKNLYNGTVETLYFAPTSKQTSMSTWRSNQGHQGITPRRTRKEMLNSPSRKQFCLCTCLRTPEASEPSLRSIRTREQ